MEREIPSSGRFFLPPLWLAEPGVAGAPSGKETRMLEALLNLDASLLLAIQDLRLDWLDPVVAFYTQLGNAGLMWIVLSLSMLCWRPTRRAGAWR